MPALGVPGGRICDRPRFLSIPLSQCECVDVNQLSDLALLSGGLTTAEQGGIQPPGLPDELQPDVLRSTGTL